ncbi:Protein Jade-1 isoform A [Senna tora]|uniref:Protein Jade-1 isoform A n=1 Tax=Senna tora TaxID=362788 RepID=A0A834T794_9FABA|nr:Protein Jade-1 isoform A [Senna tora]
MTGGRCHRRKKLMGRGVEGGGGTEESPCPVSRVPFKFLATKPGNSDNSTGLEIDYYSQARKALSERSPFDVAEETSTSTVPTLPSGLASFLNRHSESRRRHKKAHSGADKKSSRVCEKSRSSSIWVETEEYFRDLKLPDIDTLLEASTPSSLAARKCFSIPLVETAPSLNVVSNEKDKETDGNINSEVVKNEGAVRESNSVAAQVLLQDDKDHATLYSSSSLEWLLGCRNKISQSSERPSKKRKLLGGDAGLEKILIASPCEGDSSLCHFCHMGDTSGESNQLIVCDICKVVVHKKCYGVQGDVDESWLCSWCKQKDEIVEVANPCFLCPKKGGALKPINRSAESVGSVQFAHLFCCLWMPEAYVEDLKKMEPVMNVGGVKETRRKLVCNVCKVKFGACVRCSHGHYQGADQTFHHLCNVFVQCVLSIKCRDLHKACNLVLGGVTGTCRTSFHPLCAREARHRMEIELRAFCSKHSELQENSSILPSGGSVAFGSEFSVANSLPVTLPADRQHDLKFGCTNGDNIGIASDGSPDKLSHSESLDAGSSDCRLSVCDTLECGSLPQTDENVNSSDSLGFALVLKKLIDRGKVDAKDVALEIGISPDTLIANINESYMAPDVQLKIVNWLKAHVYTNAFQKSLKVKFKPPNSSNVEKEVTDGSDTLPISDSELPDPVAVKSVPPRRRTINNIRILKDNKVICSSEVVSSENGMPMDKAKVGQFDHVHIESLNESSISDATELKLTQSKDTFPESQGNADKPCKSSLSGCVSEEKWKSGFISAFSFKSQVSFCLLCRKIEENSSYIHPYISKKLLQIHDGVLSEDVICPKEEGNLYLDESLKTSGCSTNQNPELTCPEDEVEGELIYFQHRLLQNTFARKKLADNLISIVAMSLPQEIDAVHQQRWDAVLVNQYLCKLKEAKKQGRKERRHKEAQAVLAAATAAAAASSRVSSFRKDSLDESLQPENLLKHSFSGRAGVSSQPMPRAKETLPRVAVARTSSEKYSDSCLLSTDISKEHPRSCDICRRSETILNPILVCSGCKVAVHLDCYRSVKEFTGPWHCELCEDLSSRISGAPAINFWEKPYFVAECGICGGTTGAYRKSSDGQWVHAFCAEETVLKGADTCCICHRKYGVCLKCSYGHCQTAFHPTCARSAGFYMNVRTASGKVQHRAYCEKHGFEQRAKAESQKHGIEELKSIKQIRVELEKLRLLCERIVKREKIKRELVLCSHEILAFKRDHVARSVLVHSPFFLPDCSSESATTSLKGNTEGYRSCSEAVQRSDDVTVDSTVSAKHRVRVPVTMDNDPKLEDDCSTSQSRYNHKIPERVQFSGKQIPHRASIISRNLSDEGGWRSKSRKHAETFGKELVMTSDEASMKNLKLPKGYAYVPADCLSNDKQSNQDVFSNEPVERDR